MGNPSRATRWHALAAAGLALVATLLVADLTSVARVLPRPIAAFQAVSALAGVYGLGVACRPVSLVAGRRIRAIALGLVLACTYVLFATPHTLIGLVLVLVVMGGGAVLVITALVTAAVRPRRRRDALGALAVLGLAVAALTAVEVGAGSPQDVRLALVADRYRSDARAAMADPPPPPGHAERERGQLLVADPPDAAMWVWAEPLVPTGEPTGVVYAPGRTITDAGNLEPDVQVARGGWPFSCEAMAVPDFFWCSFG